MITVREATHDDLAAICEIEKQSFSDPWSEKSFAFCIDDGAFRVYVSEIDGMTAGYAVWSYLPPEAELCDIATAPCFRKKGAADSLLAAFIGGEHTKEIGNIYLEVRQSNTAAISLYEKYGFGKIGIRKNYYSAPREDALLMRLSMPDAACNR